MSGIQKLMIGEKEILSVDYSYCKEEEIIALVSELMDLALAENKKILLLSIFNDKNFITPTVMRHIERATGRAIHIIDKMAIIGLSPTKKIILKGYNLLFKKNFKAFDSREEAITYLIDENLA